MFSIGFSIGGIAAFATL